ncbi:MAG: hypothetical protein AB7I18_10270 [Candidatus Berkiella sp.]
MTSSGPVRNIYPTNEFSWSNYSYLSNDNLGRFKYSDPYIAYALVSYNSEGVPIAHEFNFPTVKLNAMHDNSRPTPPMVKSLMHIYLGRESDGEIIEAITVDNEPMTTQRSIHFKMQYKDYESKEYTLFFFSPRSNSTETQNLSWETLNQYEDYDHLARKQEIRGGEIEISYDSTESEEHSSTPSVEFSKPYEVMGRSAIDAYDEFQRDNYRMLSYGLNRILSKSISVHYPNGRSMAAFKRPEWCHAIGKQFFCKGENPNEPENLGAAPLWMNSQMMIFEESLKWHAKKYPQANIKLLSHFLMFDDSDVIYHGEMEGIVLKGNRTVQMHQLLTPHQLYPAYPQSTDIAICTFVLNGLLLGKQLKPINSTVANIEQFDTLSDRSTSSVVIEQLPTISNVPNVAEVVQPKSLIDEAIDNTVLHELLDQLENNQPKQILTLSGLKQRIPDGSKRESTNNVPESVLPKSFIDEEIDDAALCEILDQVESNQVEPILIQSGSKRGFSNTVTIESVNDDEISKLFDECEEKKWKLARR